MKTNLEEACEKYADERLNIIRPDISETSYSRHTKMTLGLFDGYELEDYAWNFFKKWQNKEIDSETIDKKFKELTKDMPNEEYYSMSEFEDLFVWNDLVHCFDHEHHHKSVLKDGTEAVWFWSWTHKTEQHEDGYYYRAFGYERIRVPLESWNGGSITTWIPDESIKEDIY